MTADSDHQNRRGQRRPLSVDEYVAGVRAGDRAILARAITLVESSAPAHVAIAQQVIQELLPESDRALRIGITGVPGAGKSTFIEALGRYLTDAGHKVAVTAVDPSSSVTGGSVLGDKTRMQRLANDPQAFVRPSPSGGTLGGVTRKTRETLLLFAAAGYDVILVETVGVGQSEAAVRSMVDFFLLILIAGAGDELQGIKRGVIELADAILVNKADGDNRAAAERARADYAQALRYIRPATAGWRTEAYAASALSGEGIAEIWRVITQFAEQTRASGAFARRRRAQERDWLHALLAAALEERFRSHPAVRSLLPELERQVVDGDLPATIAAARLLAAFGGD
jgi:LAO/AO transport system kinase